LTSLDIKYNQLTQLPVEVINLLSSSIKLYLDDVNLLGNDPSNPTLKISMCWWIENSLGDVEEDGEFEPINLNLPFDESDIGDSVWALFQNDVFIASVEALWNNYRKDKPYGLAIEIAKIEIGDNSYEYIEDDWEDHWYFRWEDGSLVSNA
jgi:hypothetical protein